MENDPHRDQPTLQAGHSLKGAKAAMLLFHGRGASASDILGVAEELSHPGVCYLATEAASHAWYPYSFLVPREQNEPWLSSSLKKAKSVVDEIIAAGIPREKIVLLGFSQGACLATEFLARNSGRYGGLIAYTGGLIGPPEMNLDYTGDLENTPVYFGSADPDPHVPWNRVEQSAAVFRTLNGEVDLQRFAGMPHTIIREELEAGEVILLRALSS